MSERLGPYVIQGEQGYKTVHGWSRQRAMALSFDDEVSARDWINSSRPRIGTVQCVPFDAEAEAVERNTIGLMPAPVQRSASDYDPFNDGPG